MGIEWYKDNHVSMDDSVGIDEVGRGPLAGPVVSAAVWISSACCKRMRADDIIVRDSKKMTQKQRQRVVEWISNEDNESIQWAIASASVEEIDSLNILNASLLSMKRAYEELAVDKSVILVDGNAVPEISSAVNSLDIRAIIDGDDKVFSISVASIIAKEYRDNIMRALDCEFPKYGWKTNVGYGSKAHLDAIREYGITKHHRKSFSPIKNMAFKDIV